MPAASDSAHTNTPNIPIRVDLSAARHLTHTLSRLQPSSCASTLNRCFWSWLPTGRTMMPCNYGYKHRAQLMNGTSGLTPWRRFNEGRHQTTLGVHPSAVYFCTFMWLNLRHPNSKVTVGSRGGRPHVPYTSKDKYRMILFREGFVVHLKSFSFC